MGEAGWELAPACHSLPLPWAFVLGMESGSLGKHTALCSKIKAPLALCVEISRACRCVNRPLLPPH